MTVKTTINAVKKEPIATVEAKLYCGLVTVTMPRGTMQDFTRKQALEFAAALKSHAEKLKR